MAAIRVPEAAKRVERENREEEERGEGGIVGWWMIGGGVCWEFFSSVGYSMEFSGFRVGEGGDEKGRRREEQIRRRVMARVYRRSIICYKFYGIFIGYGVCLDRGERLD